LVPLTGVQIYERTQFYLFSLVPLTGVQIYERTTFQCKTIKAFNYSTLPQF
jgi:hypothetical protein